MRTKKDKPTAEPLATKVRAALASDWRTLAALDTLTAARGSDARRLVHEALRALRGEGVVLEERVGRAGVEVRLAPAPVPDDGQPGDLSPEDIEAKQADALARGTAAAREWVDLAAAEGVGVEVAIADTAEPAPALDAPAPPVGQAAPVEAVGGPAEPGAPDTWPPYLDANGTIVIPCKPDRPKEPGPAARCAVCNVRYASHWTHLTPEVQPAGHPFQPKPRGRPPATPSTQPPIPNAAPAILPRVRQRRTPGPVVDVDGGRVERATPSEQAAILAGMAEQWDAAVAEHRAEREGEPETSRGGSEDRRPGLTRAPSTPTTPERYRFWSPSLGLGWLTWGEVAPSTPTRFEPDDGAAIEWIWTQCGVGRPGHREPKREGPAAAEWRAWEYFKTTSGETLVFRRGGPPPGTTAPTLTEGQRAETLATIERVSVTPPRAHAPCLPPLCHRDDIHEPARVRGFARPLCERHRAWVEGAGGTVTPACDMAALRAT